MLLKTQISTGFGLRALQSKNLLQIRAIEPEGLPGHPAAIGKLGSIFANITDFRSIFKPIGRFLSMRTNMGNALVTGGPHRIGEAMVEVYGL